MLKNLMAVQEFGIKVAYLSGSCPTPCSAGWLRVADRRLFWSRHLDAPRLRRMARGMIRAHEQTTRKRRVTLRTTTPPPRSAATGSPWLAMETQRAPPRLREWTTVRAQSSWCEARIELVPLQQLRCAGERMAGWQWIGCPRSR
jgi:hypothetical protein